MGERNVAVPQDKRLEFRIGINVGDVIVEDDDIFGDGVNVAARLEGVAEPGGIVVSAAAHDAVINRVKAEFRDLGELSLKNIERPVTGVSSRARTGSANEPADAMAPSSQPGRPNEGPSIAVRPFKVLSEDRDLEFLAKGLGGGRHRAARTGARLLSDFQGIVFCFSNPETPASIVAEQLGVRYVLEGSVRGAGDQVRVSPSSLKPRPAASSGPASSRLTRAETLELQDEIARGIIVELEPALTRRRSAVIRRQRPENVDAWGYYHQATAALGGKWVE